MPINLGDVRNKGIKIKRIDDEEQINVSPISSSNTQVISLKDIRDGKAKATPLKTVQPVNTESNKKETTNAVITQPDITSDYKDTGKKWGDYYYQEYKDKGNYKIYSKDGNFYYYDEKKQQYKPFGNQNWMTTKEQDEKDYNEAISLGYKGNKDTLKVVDRLKLDTSNLSKEEYKNEESKIKSQYKKDLEDYQEKTTPKTENEMIIEKAKKGIGRLGPTAIAGAELVGKGTVNALEGTLDWLNDMSSKVNSTALNLIGKKDLAKQEKKSRKNFIEKNLTEDLYNATGLNQSLADAEMNGSFIKQNNIGGQVAQGVGQMLPSIALSYALGVPTYEGTSTKGLTGLAKAGQVAKNIGVATAVNMPTNMMLGTSSYGNALQEAYNRGANEEQATKYAIGKSATEIATEWITGGVPGTNGIGGADILVNKGIDKISNQLAKKIVQYGYKMVGEGAEEGLSEILDPLIKNATISKGEQIDWNAVIESAIVGGITSGILEAPSTIHNTIANKTNNTQQQQVIENNPFSEFSKQVNQEMSQISNPFANQNQQNSTNYALNEELSTQPFKQEIKQTDSVQKQKIYQQLNESNILNNTKQAHDFADFLGNVSEYTQHNYTLTNNQNLSSIYENLKQSGKDTSNTIIDGFSNQNGITINVDSERALNLVVGHETTHLLENTKNYQQLQDLTIEYAKSKGEYDTKLADIKARYKGINTNINNELTADLIGEYLFTDQEFVNNLHAKNYGIFQKIHDFINHIYKMATAGSKEARQLEQVKYMFDKANKEARNSQQAISQFAISDVASQRHSRLKNTPFVDTFDGMPVYRQANGVDTFYLDDVNISDTDIDNVFNRNTQNLENTSGIEYNKQGIQLEKNEYAQVISAIHNKQAQDLNHKGSNYVYFDKYFYTFNENGFDNVIIKSKIEIKNNEGLISKLEEVLSNGTSDEKSRITDALISNVYSRQNVDTYGNVRIEAGQSNNRNDRMVNTNLSEQTGNNRTTDNRQNGTDIGQNELDDSSFSLKQKQLEIILKSNPANNTTSTWIRNIDDVKTYQETLQDSDWSDWKKSAFDPDYTSDMVQKALDTGKITVYSSYPIKQGIFVTPSKMEAESYSGNGKVYSKEVDLKDVAWIDPTQGQYAKINNNYSLSKTNQQNTSKGTFEIYGKDIKLQQDSRKQNIPLVDTFNQVQEKKLTPKTTSKEIMEEIDSGNGESKFLKNITEKSEFLTEENRNKLSQEDVWNYREVSNDESMKTAKSRLDKQGENEINRWFNEKKSVDSTDVAEGWILLEKYQREQNYDGMAQVAKKMREMGTKSGQAIQMYNVLSRLTPEGMVKYAQSELSEAYEMYAKGQTKEWIEQNHEKFDLTPDETKFIVDTMKKVEKMKDGYPKKVELAKVQKLLSDKLPPARGAGIKAWMRTSMLLNLKTQIRNVMGNAVITPVNAIADTFSAMMDKKIAKKTGKRTTGTMNISKYAKGFKEGLYQSYNDFRQDINTRDIQGNRFEIGEGKSFKDSNTLGKLLNKTDKFLGFVLDAGDRPFYEATFINSINNQLVLNNTTEITKDMIDIATQEALSRTWQDNNNYTKFVLGIRRGMNKIINVKDYGLGDVIIPFAKTPANLTKAIVDYSPVGLVKTLIADRTKFNRSLANGQYDVKTQHQYVQNLGKATAGSLLYVLGYALAKAKITTGKSDDDKDVANFMKNTLGIQSYSIKIGDKSFTYDWAQPVAAPFAIMADLVNNKNESKNLMEAITSTLDVPFNLILEQSFMSGIQDVFSNREGVPSGIFEQIMDLPARATPTFLKQIADMFDGTQRTTFEKGEPIESAGNSIKAKIPGVSKTLPATRDSLGREIKKYGGDNDIFNVFLNPANTNKGEMSKSAQEIYDIYKATSDKSVMPRVAPYNIEQTIDGKKYSKDLNAKERSEFQRISGEIIEDNVKKLKTNSKYNKLTDEGKAQAIKGIVDYAYNKAKSEILKTEISRNYKKVDEFANKGGALYDFYADKIYKDSK